jgi:VID27 N-terminal region
VDSLRHFPLLLTGSILADEERSFLLDEYLALHPSNYEGNPSFIWRDVDDEDTQAQFELVIDSNRTNHAAIEAFYSAMLRVMYERKTHKSADKLSIPQLENALHMYACVAQTFSLWLFLTRCTLSTKQAPRTTTSSSQPACVSSSGKAESQPYPEGPTLVTERAQLFLWNPKKDGYEPAFQDLVEASLVQGGQFRCKFKVMPPYTVYY